MEVHGTQYRANRRKPALSIAADQQLLGCAAGQLDEFMGVGIAGAFSRFQIRVGRVAAAAGERQRIGKLAMQLRFFV